MPFLNRRELEVGTSVGPHARHGTVLLLEFPGSALSGLLEALSKTYADGQGELRLDLPNGWAVFWKEREGESRLLLAHPSAETWVATAALTREHGQVFLERLRAGSELRLSEIVPVALMSNVEICLKPR